MEALRTFEGQIQCWCFSSKDAKGFPVWFCTCYQLLFVGALIKSFWDLQKVIHGRGIQGHCKWYLKTAHFDFSNSKEGGRWQVHIAKLRDSRSQFQSCVLSLITDKITSATFKVPCTQHCHKTNKFFLTCSPPWACSNHSQQVWRDLNSRL